MKKKESNALVIEKGAFANMRSRCKEPSRNKAEAYRVYGEHLFRRSDAADALRFAKDQCDRLIRKSRTRQ